MEELQKKPDELRVGDLYTTLPVHDRIYKFKGWRDDVRVFGVYDVSLDHEMGTNEYDDEQYAKADFIYLKDIDSLINLVDQSIADGSFYSTGTEEVEESTELMSLSSPAILQATESALLAFEDRVKLMEAALQIKMERYRKQMDSYQYALRTVHGELTKKIKQVRTVICHIEVYFGIQEQLIQIQEGMPADPGEPLTLYQAVRFVDEEIALDKLEFDFSDYEKGTFDEWLLKEKHYERFIPAKRGMVAFKARRKEKTYFKNEKDSLLNYIYNAPNFTTYFLIRNGDNIYKLRTSNISIHEKMFPGKREFQSILDTIEKEGIDGYERHKAKERKKEFEESVQPAVQRLIFLIQGLLDRSEVFAGHTLKMNLFKDIEAPDLNFIYDLDGVLGTGELSFRDWLEENKKHIKKGSQILMIGADGDAANFKRYYQKNCQPPAPGQGIYKVHFEEMTNRWTYKLEEAPVIYYNPKDEIWTGNWRTSYEERKRNLAFNISSSQYLVYDVLTLEDIEFYLNSMIARKDYSYSFPFLIQAKKFYLREMEAENAYVQMLVDEIHRRGLKAKTGTEEEVVRYYIKWYKDMLVWKRPISEKEEAAHSMITRRLFSKKSLKENFV